MYYVRIRGRVFGPLEENQIVAMVRQGKLGRMNEISTDNRQWVRADEFEQFFPKHTPKHKPSDSLKLLEDETPDKGPSPHSGQNTASKREIASATIWYYSNDGKTGLGPFPKNDIVQMIEQGQITGQTILWYEGLDPQKAETLSDFEAYFDDADHEKNSKPSGRKTRKAKSQGEISRRNRWAEQTDRPSSLSSEGLLEQLGKASAWSFALALFVTIGAACLLFSQLFQFVMIMQSGSTSLTLIFLLATTVVDLIGGYVIFAFWRYVNAIKQAAAKADHTTLALAARRTAEFWRACIVAPLVLCVFALLVFLLIFTVGMDLMKAPMLELQRQLQIERPDGFRPDP